jgi:hypothetical protein
MDVPDACWGQTVEPSIQKQASIETFNVQGVEFYKSELTERWDKVNSNDAFVSLKRLSRYAGLGVFKPTAEIVLQRDTGRLGIETSVKVVLKPPEFAFGVSLGAVDRGRFLSPLSVSSTR